MTNKQDRIAPGIREPVKIPRRRLSVSVRSARLSRGSPSAGSVVDRQWKELVTAAVPGQNVARVVRHKLARRIHDFHVKDVALGRRFFLQAEPDLSGFSA